MTFIIVVVISTLLAGLAEAAVRLRQWLKHGYVWGVEEILTQDSNTGLRLPLAGAALGPISINTLGFRGGEIVQPKPAETLRIAFIGGSTTYCAEVSDNALVWPHLVTEALKIKFPTKQIDYVNAGVPGFTLASSLQNLKLRVAPLEPDVIVIYHATNDLSDNGLHLARQQGIIERQGRENSFGLMKWLTENSILVHLVEKNLQILMRQQEFNSTENSTTSADTSNKLAFNSVALRQPFEKDLRSLLEESKRLAKMVVLITFSQRLRPDQNAEQQKEAAITHGYYFPYFSIENLIAGFALYNDVIRDLAIQYDALLIGGEDDIPSDAQHFTDSVHFADAGSQAMAQRVATVLLASERFRTLLLEPN